MQIALQSLNNVISIVFVKFIFLKLLIIKFRLNFVFVTNLLCIFSEKRIIYKLIFPRPAFMNSFYL